MSLVERPPDPGKRYGLVRMLADALLGIGSPIIRRLVAGVMLIALMVLVLPLAIVVFIATSLLYYGVAMLLGTSANALGAALGLAWFGGSLALIGWLCILAWRRLWFIRVLAGLASPAAGDEPGPIASSSIADPHADSDTVLTRVAAADARLEESAGNPGDAGAGSPRRDV